MFEQNKSLWAITTIVALAIGFGAGWALKPIPDPDIQWTLGGGLTINGKPIDLEKLKVNPPNIFGPDNKDKKKPGDLGAGELGPAASIYHEIDQKNILKNVSGSDGAGISVPVCLEIIGRHNGFKDLEGFAEWTSKRPGGHYPKKTINQFEDFKIGKQFVVDLLIIEPGVPLKTDTLRGCLENHGPFMVAYNGRFDDHYSGYLVNTAVIVNGFSPSPGNDKFTVIDPNWPSDRIAVPAEKLSAGIQWIACLVPDSAYKTQADCPCGPSCTCNPCHCHAAKAISFVSSQDDQPVVAQRGGNSKSPELFGIETLAAALNKLHEAIFGGANKPGLRDDIANGLRDFYGTFRTGVVVAGVSVAGWMLWVGISLQRIADKPVS